MKTKTVKQWLITLDEPTRSEAFKCTAKSALKLKKDSLRLAVQYIAWGFSEFTHEYWYSFYEALLWAEEEDRKDLIKTI